MGGPGDASLVEAAEVKSSLEAVSGQTQDQAKACSPTDQPVRKFKHNFGITMSMKTSLLSGQSDILVPYSSTGMEWGPPRGARSGGHDSCQAARTAATCAS